MNDILILTSGSIRKLDAFKDKGVDLGSFNDINYSSNDNSLKLKEVDLKQYKTIYFRMVGKSLEIATLVTDYAIKNNIRIVDKIYTKSKLMPPSLGKSIEIRRLIEANITIPKTVFAKFDELTYPFVIKSTTSSRAREVWLVNNQEEYSDLLSKVNKTKFLFGQEYIPNAHRARLLVVGNKVIGGIVRHTKWNKDGTRTTLDPIPEEMALLAIKATEAVDLEICGIDLLIDEQGKLYVIEANAAPSWKLINKNCNVSVEDEIIKYIRTKI